jgi:dienelactone hydrolase
VERSYLSAGRAPGARRERRPPHSRARSGRSSVASPATFGAATVGPSSATRGAALAALVLVLGCVSTPATTAPRAPVDPAQIPAALAHEPLDVARVRVSPEPITVEDAFILDLYTWLHRRDYATFRVELPAPTSDAATSHTAQSAAQAIPAAARDAVATDAGSDAPAPGIAHLLIPPGPGPHPTVVVYPILAGSHVVSEALAKAIVRRGYLVARLEREALMVENAESAEEVAETLRSSLIHGRRLLDYLESRPDVDKDRIAAMGISLGSMLACLLHGVDDRIRAGAYIMTGGGLPEIMADSTEVPVRMFREKIMEREGMADAGVFADYLRGPLSVVDPLTYASHIDPRSVWMLTARFDRVIRPAHADALRAALGEPARVKVPTGHYQILPFFWWGIARAVDHLDAVLGVPAVAETPAQP